MPLDPIPFLLLCGWFLGAGSCAAVALRWLIVERSASTVAQAALLVAGGGLTYFFYAWFLAFRYEVNSWSNANVLWNFALGVTGAVCIAASLGWRSSLRR